MFWHNFCNSGYWDDLHDFLGRVNIHRYANDVNATGYDTFYSYDNSGVDGPDLVNTIFGSRSTFTTLSEAESPPVRNYLGGLYGLLRKKYAHTSPPLDLVELAATLSGVNYGLRLVVGVPPTRKP